MTTSISLRDPGDLVATLPYQLGYHPRRSVVAVALHGRRVGLVARTDLPRRSAELGAVAGAITGPLCRERPDGVFLVGYEDEPDEAVPLLRTLAEDLAADGTELVDVVVVRDGRRYSRMCDRACCPPEGVPLPAPDRVPGIAELVALGSAPLPGRDDVDRMVAADPSLPSPPPRRRPRGARPVRRPTAAGAWAALLGAGPDRDAVAVTARAHVARVATAAASLQDVPLRDAVIAWLVPGVLPREVLDPSVLAVLEQRMPRWGGMGRWEPPGGSGAPAEAGAMGVGPVEVGPAEADPGERRALLDVVLAACRAVPDDRPEDAAAMCTVAAHVAWHGGDGALARAALDRALRLAPDYRLAGLLDRLVTHGIRPSTLPPAEPRRAG